ncbi:MAG: tyrosine-type recombinase/integrase, partial [Thiohalospira sp.]
AARLDPWVQRAMELALVSGQPRDVIAAARFDQIEDGAWWCHRPKTDVQIMIPLELRLEAVGWSLDDVVRACRDRVVSRRLIHHTRPRTKSSPGDPVHKDTISRRFARARELAGITGPNPPTFHEIRSLAEWLYSDQGIDTQALLGHRDPRTTAIYHDRRGSEWVRVKVG